VVNISANPPPSELTWYIGDVQVNGMGGSSSDGHFTARMVSSEVNPKQNCFIFMIFWLISNICSRLFSMLTNFMFIETFYQGVSAGGELGGH
jgi:hypothetical protein